MPSYKHGHLCTCKVVCKLFLSPTKHGNLQINKLFHTHALWCNGFHAGKICRSLIHTCRYIATYIAIHSDYNNTCVMCYLHFAITYIYTLSTI